MKLIEGLKKIKELEKKADDIKVKVSQHSAYLNYETPMYENQSKQVSAWLQSYSDILKEILHLRIAIQKTNLCTTVDIELGGKTISKTIAEWIHRRRDLAEKEKMVWMALTDKGLKEGRVRDSNEQVVEVKIVRCYSPAERDEKVALFDSEPTIIDSKLEVINAITDLVE